MAGFRPRGTPEVPDLDLDSLESGKTTGTRPTSSGPPPSGTSSGEGKETTGPELDLPVHPPPISKPSIPNPTPSGRSALEDMDEDEAATPPSLSLDLDTSGPPPLPPAVSAPVPPVSQRSLPPTVSGSPVVERTSMPASGPVSVGGPIHVDPYD